MIDLFAAFVVGQEAAKAKTARLRASHAELLAEVKSSVSKRTSTFLETALCRAALRAWFAGAAGL